MIRDDYNSVWVSHSSIGDFLKCPRLYFLRNIYKNERGRKISIASPPLSLGKAVHDTLEGLSQYKAEERFSKSLADTFEEHWKKVSGKYGGFKAEAEEAEAKERGKNMIERVSNNPGPLLNKTIKLMDKDMGSLLNFYLSKKDGIILCGRIDWLEYVDADDSIKVLDFKTGKNAEKKDSLQLPIYALLLKALQRRKVSGASYWYVDKDDAPISVELPDIQSSAEKLLFISRKIKEARERKVFNCPRGRQGCFACRPFEKILEGKAEFVGVGEYNQEIYIV
ncbi:MAG: PD-(D/E)XK nuclease family protein [Candidatus Staskawiczbacteria bacterium]|jgi:RecB family exonuclease